MQHKAPRRRNVHLQALLLVVSCFLFPEVAFVAENGLPDNAKELLSHEFPGYTAGQFVKGSLVGPGTDDLAILIFREDPENDWLIHRIVVLGAVAPDKYRVVESSGLITAPMGSPAETYLSIAKRSLFVHDAAGGMRTSSTTDSQYRYDAASLSLIGVEQKKIYHGDGPPEEGEEEVRVSYNVLTGKVITYSQGKTKTEQRKPEKSRLSDLGEH